MSPDTFKKVSNNEMFDKIINIHDDVLVIKEKLKNMDDKINFHKKWLWGLTGALCTGFLFIIGILLKN